MLVHPTRKLCSAPTLATAAVIGFAALGGSWARAQYQLQVVAAPAGKSSPDHSERCLAAIDLAIIAAESGAMDVSIEAMRRASREGPPVASIDLGGILSSGGRSQSGPFTRGRQETPADAAQARLSAQLCKLHDVWVEHEVDAAKAYQAWKDLVLPPTRPNDAFAYSSGGTLTRSTSYGNMSLNVKPPNILPSGAANLVYWARKAERLDDLGAELEARVQPSGAADTTLLLRVILASHEDSPVEEAEALCRALAARPALLIDHPYAELNFGHAWELIERLGSDSPAAQELVDALLSSTRSHPRWAANRWLKFLVVWKLNDTIERGDREEFHQTAQVAMSQYDPIRAGNSDFVASCEASFYAEASKRAFAAGHEVLGIECMQALALLPGSSRFGGPSLQTLLDARNPMMKGLLKMEPEERLEFLSTVVWPLPMLGLDRYATLRPTDHVPSVFVRDDSAAQRRSRITRDDALCYSLLEWTMRESLLQGNAADVEARIDGLQSRGSDDAKLARLLWDLTRGERVDFTAFSETGEDGKPRLVPTMGSDRVSLLDLELMRAAINDDEWREAGGKFLDERLPIGVNKAQLPYVAWMRSLRLDFYRATGKPVVTQEALAHWTVSNNPSHYEFLAGHYPTSIWAAQEDGMWNHQTSPHWSYLFLRYPVEGDFAFELHSPDYPWREGAVAVGGLFVEFLRHDGRLLLRPMAERAGYDIRTSAMKPEHLNRYLVETKDGKVNITVGDGDFTSELGEYSSHFPFITLSSIFYRDASFGKLKVTGEPTIPREVNLLSEDLQGWTDYLKHGKLPLLKITPTELGLDPAKQGEIREWHFVGDELQSIDQVAERAKRNAGAKSSAKPYEEKRREAIIQYLRPLCDGEQIDLEFYYEPGKFCLAPTLGRIALLLDEPDMGLHWVTFDNELWTGVETTNRVVDPDAQQLAPIELKEKAWNELQLRLEGETLVVSLNGKPVYRREWEQEVDRKFGLFHDPTRYHVRVRNVRLSGDWPEKLPTDFWELRPGSKI